MSGGFFDMLSIAGMAAGEKLRRLSSRMRRSSPSRLVSSYRPPERLLLAPQDLNTADPTAALDIYSGRFFLAGKSIDCQGEDPFGKGSAPLAWQEELHAFGWIRHLDAEGSTRSKTNIQALISDWLKRHARPSRHPAWKNGVAARRLIAWLCHSVPVVEAATPKFYQAWLKSIGTHIRHLKYRAGESAPGLELLTVRIALAYAEICTSGQGRNLRNARRLLNEELATQIFTDGGHVSRNPQALIEILSLLLPLRESYKRLGTAPSGELVSAIDRMMAALKFYRLGDGNLARFNGVTGGRPDLLATILQYDDSLGTASESASQSGYERLAMGETILLADTGAPPPRELSLNAHAGTLSFELSSGNNLVMVNCGRPVNAPGATPDPKDGAKASVMEMARTTAAHNTLTISDTSSSRIYRGGRFARLLGKHIIFPAGNVTCRRENTPDSKLFEAGHDGYRSRFGARHIRKLRLTAGGDRIEGTDRLVGNGGKPLSDRKPLTFTIRFHLHPSVSAGKTDNGASILMMCGNGLAWKLTCLDCRPEIEESIYLSSLTGPKRSKQIVLTGDASTTPEVRWLLARQRELG